MKKTIYQGADRGLYVFGEFQRFMKSRPEAEPVRSKFSLDDRLFQIWHWKGTTLHYGCTDGVLSSSARVDVIGELDKIGEVERLIYAEAEKYRVAQK